MKNSRFLEMAIAFCLKGIGRSKIIAVLVTLGILLIEFSPLDLLNRSVLANSSYQVQETTVFLNSEDLTEPHLLKVKASSSLSYLSGSVSCNGSIIQLLGNGKTQLNLSPYLRPGQNSVVILGRYSPSGTSIDVELVGPDNQVSQSISGSGVLNQSILIDVQ